MIYIFKSKKAITIIVSITILLICIWNIIFIAGFDADASKKQTIENYKKDISNNNEVFAKYEEIKQHLNITANKIRETDNYNVEFVDTLSQKWHDYNNLQNNLKNENNLLQSKIDKLTKELSDEKLVGYFTITHYSINSCGKSPSHPAYGITATGTRATPGITIAVDPRVIPYGSEVIINGHIYIAEDTGGGIKGNKIDICVSSNSEAFDKGVLYNVPVYIKRVLDNENTTTRKDG